MKQESISMEVVHPHAGDVDLDSSSHWEAIGQSEMNPHTFGVFNPDLFAMVYSLSQSGRISIPRPEKKTPIGQAN